MTRRQADVVESVLSWLLIGFAFAYMAHHTVAAYCDGRIF